MSDWVGLAFILLLVIGAIIGLRALAKPRVRTSEEFEKGVAEAGTSFAGAVLGTLQDATDPASARAKIVVQELKQGRYQKKKRDAKACGNLNEDEEND
jgi:hypothetical protein